LNDLTMRSALSELLQTLPFVLYPQGLRPNELSRALSRVYVYLPDNRLKYTNSWTNCFVLEFKTNEWGVLWKDRSVLRLR